MKPKFFYILDENNNPIRAESHDAWEKWFIEKREPIKQENIGNYWISTVFSGVSMDMEKPIGCFVTAVFDKGTNREVWAKKFDEFKWWESYHRLGVGEALERMKNA